jgi:hypothetical protein
MADVTGGCQCGAIRYSITESRPPVYVCHCRECQRQSASAFALSVPVRGASFEVQGELACYERGTDSGATTNCYFCSRCGTRIYHRSNRSPEQLTVKGGTLDDPSALHPVAHLWVSRRQPWLTLDNEIPHYATQPENFAEWRSALMGAGP